MAEGFSRFQNEIQILPVFEDLLKVNIADYGRKDSGVRVREVGSSNPETITNLICKQHQTHCLALNKCL